MFINCCDNPDATFKRDEQVHFVKIAIFQRHFTYRWANDLSIEWDHKLCLR